MAETMRVTAYYSQSNMGWSETWWRSAEEIDSMGAPLKEMLEARAGMLTTDVKTVGVRISQEGSSRVSRLLLPGLTQSRPGVPVFDIPGAGTLVPGNLGFPSDQVRAALQIEVVVAQKRISLRYLAGIPDELSQTEPGVTNFTEPAHWWNRYRAWRDIICTKGWLVKVSSKSGGSGERPIRSWVLDTGTDPVVGFVVDGSPGIAASEGLKVAVRASKMRAEGLRSPNGTWVVDKVTDTVTPDRRTIYLRGATGFLKEDIKVMGVARLVASAYVAPSNLQAFRVGIHKRGRPFGSPPGRRKIRKFV